MAVLRRVAIGVGLTAAFAGLVARFFIWPTTAADPTASDAVVVLAGAPKTRLPVAVRLAERGPHVLVVSAVPGESGAPARALCEHPHDLTVYCFDPQPEDTRGEARTIGKLTAEHGWHQITVVTSTYHVTRAGVLVRRCTDARVLMVAASSSLSVSGWLDRVAHEFGGLVLAAVQRSC